MRDAFYDINWLYRESTIDGGQGDQLLARGLMGLALGYDHCAEHEEGIKRMEQHLGTRSATERSRGVEYRQMTQGAGDFYFFKGKKTVTVKGGRKTVPYAVMGLEEWLSSMTPEGREAAIERHKKNPPSGVNIYRDGRDSTEVSVPKTPRPCWDKYQFCVTVYGKEDIAKLELLYKASQENDLCVSTKFSGPFGGAGLCLTIASELPDELKAHVLKTDLDYIELQEAAEATGVEKAIKDAGLHFYALVPQWYPKASIDPNAKPELRFFLNPAEQNKNESGWFTPAELIAWTKGEGPVVKKLLSA